jgi:acetate kinase
MHILTINGGSSSVKFALFAAGEKPERLLSGKIERIGLAETRLVVTDSGRQPEDRGIQAPTRDAAAKELVDWLSSRGRLKDVAAIGHRIVHGGPRFQKHQRITPDLIAELRRLSDVDPEHLPFEIELMESFGRRCPDLPQFACFDTAFHRDLPRVASLLPIPRRFDIRGIRRYGFHGLSCAYLMEELGRLAGPEVAWGRVVLAHLGNGASITAVRNGKSVDTSMGFTPCSGLPMSTRTGDLDAGLMAYLNQSEKLTPEQFQDLVNHRSGLLGVSEISSDMRDLLSQQKSDHRAAEAVDLFCYQAKKWIGAFAAVLGGLDILVFSGGIGENGAEVRARICQGLEFLGILIDPSQNGANAPIISGSSSAITVRVIRTDEEVMIAKEVVNLLSPRREEANSKK